MNKIQQITAYLCIHYPIKSELTKARLTKMVYLADWFSALTFGRQLTNIQWVFNHYGPYVEDIVFSASDYYGFKIISEYNVYGSPKSVISYHGKEFFPDITFEDKKVLDLVIDKTRSMYFNEFITYVYSTYPIKSNEKYSSLDLVSLAHRYKSSL